MTKRTEKLARRSLALTVAGLGAILFFQSAPALAADAAPAAAPAEAPAAKTMLPQEHEYQRVLRNYMATLTVKDFDHGVTKQLTLAPPDADVEVEFRNYILSLMLAPLVGDKRGIPSVNSPSRLYTLNEIEGAKIMNPPCVADALMSFTCWNYPGNTFYNNRALKMRAFVVGAVNLIMLDDYLTKNPTHGRADWYGYELVNWGMGYSGFKDELPPEVQKAYGQALRRMAERVIGWGVRGEEPNLDMITPIGLWYASQAVGDPEFTAKCTAYAKMMLTDPKYLHPAGYWYERGGIDTGFGGMAHGFVVWAALASDWDFAKQAVEKIYRLRAHLDLPEPDGAHTGPSAFNSRIGTAVFSDQWGNAGVREFGAAMITDEAAYTYPLPTAEEMKEGINKRVAWQNRMLFDELKNPYIKLPDGSAHYLTNDELKAGPWRRLMWQNWQFPLSINSTFEYYKKGAYAHLTALAKANSPMTKSPFLRGENFLRDFAKAFFVTRQPTYAAILHTGPIGRQRESDGLFQWKGPMGFGGGQLAAFWTPDAGTVLVNRRSAQNWDKVLDKPEEWRNLPLHAVSGITADGKTFTSGRIADPVVASEIKGELGTVKASGKISTDPKAINEIVEGTIGYSRLFEIGKDSLRVETSIEPGAAAIEVAELYETLPVFHREGGNHQGPGPKQPDTLEAKIEFKVDGNWVPATTDAKKVAAIRISRFKGAATITFEQPQRVKLSPANWQDMYLSHASCRNVLIDLIDNDDKPTALKAKKIAYRIEAAK